MTVSRRSDNNGCVFLTFLQQTRVKDRVLFRRTKVKENNCLYTTDLDGLHSDNKIDPTCHADTGSKGMRTRAVGL